LDDVFREALKAFATLGYDGVSMRNLNRDSGGSHNLLSGRFGSKKTLWYATVPRRTQPRHSWRPSNRSEQWQSPETVETWL
jgi:hypothetical protein